MKVLFIDSNHPCLQEELQKNGFECHLNYTWSKEQIEKNIHLYEGIVIRSRILLTKDLLEKATRLKFIARVGAGMENIDVAYAENKGIKCLHAPEGNRDAVAEHALGMLLSLFNNLCRANKEVREGKWIREGNRGVELSGKTVGIIGYGNMGRAFAKRLKGFDVSVLAYDKYVKGFSNNDVKESSMEDIFENADVLSLHIPLTEETQFLVNDESIRNFKKNIYLINTARGQCVKTDDLVKNLKSGKIAGACLDVLEYEDVSFEGLKPVSFGKPTATEGNQKSEEYKYLMNSEKVMLSPHIAGWTVESKEKLARVLVEKILRLQDKFLR